MHKTFVATRESSNVISATVASARVSSSQWARTTAPMPMASITANKMCEDAQDLSYFGRADGQCEKFSILNLRCRGLHAWVEIDQSHLLP